VALIGIAHDGRIVRPVVHIPGLGGPKGMLIFQDYDEVRPCADAIVRVGYGYSVLDQPRPDEKFDLATFREMFTDWG
jgi:hypothetical protein